MNDPATIVERRDLLEHLAARGFAPLLEALGDPRCYKRDGRLNIRALARALQMSWYRANLLLQRAREAIPWAHDI
jgi:hypothetical protein